MFNISQYVFHDTFYPKKHYSQIGQGEWRVALQHTDRDSAQYTIYFETRR